MLSLALELAALVESRLGRTDETEKGARRRAETETNEKVLADSI